MTQTTEQLVPATQVPTIQQVIEEYKPCTEAEAWLLEQESVEAAWEKCERGDWMLRLLHKNYRMAADAMAATAADAYDAYDATAAMAADAYDDAYAAYAAAATAAIREAVPYSRLLSAISWRFSK